MRKIDDAAAQWAIEKGQKTGDPINFPADLTPYIRLNKNNSIPGCPAGGTYTVANIGLLPSVTCSLGNTVTPAHKIP
jgi:hypothetical protein